MNLEYINPDAEYALWVTRTPRKNNRYEDNVNFFLQSLNTRKRVESDHLDSLVIKGFQENIFANVPEIGNITTIKNGNSNSEIVPANEALFTSFLLLYKLYSRDN